MEPDSMPRGIVVLTICGDNEHYRDAAEVAVRSVLDKTDMHVFVGIDFEAPGEWVQNRRVELYNLSERNPRSIQPMFLRKFETLAAACQSYDHTTVLQMDADAVIVEAIDAADLESELGRQEFAMVEQKTIIGSDHDRAFFLRHYVDHVLTWFGTNLVPPLSEFRYFNSGVVLARSRDMRVFIRWALLQIDKLPPHHRVGQHMIADQDYLQYWCNSVKSGSCRELPWYWNHCEHWDEGFPRKGARICHFSNFCHGPTADSVRRMADLHTRYQH